MMRSIARPLARDIAHSAKREKLLLDDTFNRASPFPWEEVSSLAGNQSISISSGVLEVENIGGAPFALGVKVPVSFVAGITYRVTPDDTLTNNNGKWYTANNATDGTQIDTVEVTDSTTEWVFTASDSADRLVLRDDISQAAEVYTIRRVRVEEL